MCFAHAGTILGGIPFGPTVVELKDPQYDGVPLNDGNFIFVSVVSAG